MVKNFLFNLGTFITSFICIIGDVEEYLQKEKHNSWTFYVKFFLNGAIFLGTILFSVYYKWCSKPDDNNEK